MFKPEGLGTHHLRSPKQTARPLTVSERSGFRFSLRNRKATTGMMQTTVVSTMVSHTVGWARVFWALPGKRGAGGFRSHRAGIRAAPESSPLPFLAAPLSQSQNLSHLWPLSAPQMFISKSDSSSKLSPNDFRSAFVFVGFFWLCCAAYRILVPQPGMESIPLAVEVRSLNHWTIRDVPRPVFLTALT